MKSEGVKDYRPIALANFAFKIITKIVADLLGVVAARIISPNQSAFIKGHSVVDLIYNSHIRMLESLRPQV